MHRLEDCRLRADVARGRHAQPADQHTGLSLKISPNRLVVTMT